MSQQLRVTRRVDFTGATLVGFGGEPHLAGGKVLFVNGTSWGNGSNGYEGTNPDYPLYDIDTALGKCLTEHHDYIFVLDYWDNDTFPVVVDKSVTHIIGLGGGGVINSWNMLNSGAAAGFEIGGNPNCEIAGFSFIADASNPGIEVGTNNTRIHIHHCIFGEHGTCQDGILSESGVEFNWSLVENCIFGKELGRDGCRLYAPTWSYINNNIFRKYTGIGVNINGSSSARLGGILDNRFFQKLDGATGCAITITSAQNGIIDGNHAMEDGGHAGNNPYLDTTTGTDTTTQNAWGVNYFGNLVKYPAFTA